jgi:prephenate dehydratase
MPRLAYLGPPGTFTEEAALRYMPDADLVSYQTESAVVVAVESGEAAQGVLAIENSLEGTVTRTVDSLIHDSHLSIAGEVVLAIEHCLIARPGTHIEDIKVIRAHPQALSQCRKYIERRLPGVRQEASLSNAAAVEEAMRLEGAAAIAGARAAEVHGAQVLDRGIADNAHNKTRFVVLAHEDGAPTGRDKTSIAFTVAHDQPGTLVEVLHEFSDRAINLTKIESRPSREELGIYIFLIDLDGHRIDDAVGEALAAVKAKAQFFRILGSYPRFNDA